MNRFEQKPRLHIKLGSSCVANGDGLDLRRMEHCAQQMSELAASHRVSLTSSGAVARGRRNFVLAGKSLEDAHLRSLAAAGSAGVVDDWNRVLIPRGMVAGQVPIIHDEINDEERTAKLLVAYEQLEADELIPIDNNNDVLTHGDQDDELQGLEQRSDNDFLAADMARLLMAEAVIFCVSDARGFEVDGTVLSQVRVAELPGLKRHIKEPSMHGTGGMWSKLQAAASTAGAGIKSYICHVEADYAQVLAGRQTATQVLE